MNYELVIPKTDFDALNFYFTTRQNSEFAEVNNNGEFFRREIAISSLIGQSVIDDIVAWNSIPAAPNTCEESIDSILDSTYVVDGSPKWYKFTADNFMDLDISIFEDDGSRIYIYDGCDGVLLKNENSRNSDKRYTMRLLKDQEIYFKLENYEGIIHKAFKFELSATYLKEYLISSIPENTPEDASIFAIDSDGFDYLLSKKEGTDLYQLVFDKDNGEITFSFQLNAQENFTEVDEDEQLVTRTIDTSDNSVTELNPIFEWNNTPLSPNTCDTAIEISEEGKYLKGTGSQWYTYTALEDVLITLSVEDYGKDYGVTIYDECGGQSLAYADRLDGDLRYNVSQGETILIKWDNYDDHKSYEWTLETQVTKTFVIRNVPKNTPENWDIHAVGRINEYNIEDTFYKLEYIEEDDQYEVTFREDLGTVEFYFVLEEFELLREVDVDGNTMVRTIDLANTPSNTVMEDIIEWKTNQIYHENDCADAYAIDEDSIIVNGGQSVGYNFESDKDAVLILSTIDVTDIDTEVYVYDECGGEELAYNDDAQNTTQSYVELRLEAGESVAIKWDTYSSSDKGFIWSLDTVTVSKQSINDFVANFVNISTYDLADSTLFSSDQGIYFDVAIESGDAQITADNKIVLNSSGEVTLHLTNAGDDFYFYTLDTVVTINIEKTVQTLLNEEFISSITTVGKFVLPEHHTSDQGLSLDIEAISENIVIDKDTLLFNASGETQLRVYNEGNDIYQSLDSIITFNVNKLSISSYETNYFDTLQITGEYILPNFVTEEGVVLTASLTEGDGEIVDGTLKLYSTDQYEVELATEETPMVEAFAIKVIFEVDKEEVPTSLESELSKAMTLFPNPAKRNVTLQLSAIDGEVALSVISASGQVLKVENIKGALQHKLDISNLNTGVYILRINTVNGVGVKRLIVK